MEGKQQATGAGALDETLASLFAEAEESCPDVGLGREDFATHVIARLPAGIDPLVAIRNVHGADLYLACACAAGSPRALALLGERMLEPLARHLERTAPALAEEIVQTLRTRVLVADGDKPPRIASYDGRGPLSAWLRVAAARITVDLQRSQRPHDVFDEDDAPVPRAADPELAFLRTHYRAELAEAFRATVRALPARDANVLRLHHLEQATAQAIAGMYGVSSRTVEHWLTSARRRILAETRRALADRLRLAPSELDSIMGLAQSQLDLTLPSILAPESK